MGWSLWEKKAGAGTQQKQKQQSKNDGSSSSSAVGAGSGSAGGTTDSNNAASPPTRSAARSTPDSARAATLNATRAIATGVTKAAKTIVGEIHEVVKETIEDTNDFQSEIFEEEQERTRRGGQQQNQSRTSLRSSIGSRSSSSSYMPGHFPHPHNNNNNNNYERVKFHVESFLEDHYSLIVPSSTVRFRPGSSPSTGGRRTSVMTSNSSSMRNTIGNDDTAAATAATNIVMTTIAEDTATVPSPSAADASGNGEELAAAATTGEAALEGHQEVVDGIDSAATFFTASRVIEDASTQIILEERYDLTTRSRKIIVKRVATGSKGLQLLRIIYTLLCALWLGIFLAVSVQLILSMVLDVSIVTGQTSISGDLVVWKVIGVILGLIQITVSLAEGLVIGTRFVLDAWGGHHVIRELFFLRRDLVFVDWMYFWFVLGIPTCVLICCLFAKSDVFLEITGIVWFSSISIIFAFFTIYTIWYEVRGAVNFVKNDLDRKGLLGDQATNEDTKAESNHNATANFHREHSIQDLTSSTNPKSSLPLWFVLKNAILMRQVSRYSGKTRHRYIAKSMVPEDYSDMAGDILLSKSDMIGSSFVEHIAVFSRISQWDLFTKRIPLFTKLDDPKKLFSLADAQGTRAFLTKWTWSLEKVFCNPQRSSTVAIIDGPGALTRRQIRSTLYIQMLGMTLIALLILSTLTWFDFGPGLIALASILVFFVVFASIYKVYKGANLILSLKSYRDTLTKNDVDTPVIDTEHGDENLDEKYRFNTKNERRTYVNQNARKYIKGMNTGVYIVIRHYRLTQANPWLCWTMMLIEIFLFWIWPCVALFMMSDVTVGLIFTTIVFVSGIRHYLNIATVIQETGRMDLTAKGKTKAEKWANMSRLTTILESVSLDQVKWIWTAVLAFCGFAFVFLYFGGLLTKSSVESTSTTRLTFLPPDFYYPPQPEDIRYPTCSIAKAEQFGIKNEKLYDFAFLASLTYRDDDVIDQQLPAYFSNDGRVINATDERDYVRAWRNATDNNSSPVKFHLFRFTSQSKSFGVVAIRGSAKPWDWLVNNQLWQAAMITQGVRAVLPIGGVFTPYLPSLVTFINSLQSSLITEVSYYKTVTPFVEYVKADPDYDNVVLTGHSLGGGIAIISGAQSQTPVIAVSGPNSMLSRRSFNPPFTKESLNRYTFNVVPDRDMVPKFDDLAQNYQRIRCLGPLNSPFECHNNLRAFCEIMFNCGSSDRLVPCECVTVFEYEEPLNNGTQSFAELCENSGSQELGW